MRAFGWFALLPATLLGAWGLGLLVTAGQDTEGVREMFGWIFLVSGLLLAAIGAVTLIRDRRR